NGYASWSNGWLTYGHRSAGRYREFKSDSWDGAFRVPFIVHWPDRVDRGVTNEAPICLVDLLATFADVTGDDLQEHEGRDSYSFMSNILDHTAPPARKSMTLVGGASGAFVAISDGWKYIEAAPPGRWPETYYPNGPDKMQYQLYNLKEDPAEEKNLFEEMPQKVEEMISLIERVKGKGRTELRITNDEVRMWRGIVL